MSCSFLILNFYNLFNKFSIIFIYYNAPAYFLQFLIYLQFFIIKTFKT